MTEVLLVFDLNGTLLLRKNGRTYLRKNLNELKKICFSIADVAIYTSMLAKNIKLNEIFTNEEIKKLKFVWDRSRTIKDEEGINEWDTIKDLNMVIKEYPDYKSIIFIDDSPNKLRHISEGNKIIIAPFVDIKEEDNVLEDLINSIKKII